MEHFLQIRGFIPFQYCFPSGHSENAPQREALLVSFSGILFMEPAVLVCYLHRLSRPSRTTCGPRLVLYMRMMSYPPKVSISVLEMLTSLILVPCFHRSKPPSQMAQIDSLISKICFEMHLSVPFSLSDPKCVSSMPPVVFVSDDYRTGLQGAFGTPGIMSFTIICASSMVDDQFVIANEKFTRSVLQPSSCVIPCNNLDRQSVHPF